MGPVTFKVKEIIRYINGRGAKAESVAWVPEGLALREDAMRGVKIWRTSIQKNFSLFPKSVLRPSDILVGKPLS